MGTPLVIIGCGGFGREVHDVVDAINAREHTWDLLGYLDDEPSEVNRELVERRGSEVLGGTDWLDSAPAEVNYVIGIGAPAIKSKIDARAGDRPAATLVHPTVVMGFDVHLGAGTVICARVCLTTNIRVGRHAHLNQMCSIGHDVVVHDHVSINPMAAISGWVDLADGCLIESHATVLQNLRVGVGATVGGAACVVRNVANDSVVKGVPAR